MDFSFLVPGMPKPAALGPRPIHLTYPFLSFPATCEKRSPCWMLFSKSSGRSFDFSSIFFYKTEHMIHEHISNIVSTKDYNSNVLEKKLTSTKPKDCCNSNTYKHICCSHTWRGTSLLAHVCFYKQFMSLRGISILLMLHSIYYSMSQHIFRWVKEL